MKKAIFLFLFMLTLGFADNNYKTRIKATSNLTSQQINDNNAEIEKGIKLFFNSEEVEKKLKMGSENENTDTYLKIFASFLGNLTKIVLTYTKYSITEIVYNTDENAQVILNISIPDVENSRMLSSENLNTAVNNRFKMKTKKNIEDIMELSEEEQEKYTPVFLEALTEVLNETFRKNRDYKNIEKTISFNKENGVWVTEENFFDIF